jgi:hypothetical protein
MTTIQTPAARADAPAVGALAVQAARHNIGAVALDLAEYDRDALPLALRLAVDAYYATLRASRVEITRRGEDALAADVASLLAEEVGAP